MRVKKFEKGRERASVRIDGKKNDRKREKDEDASISSVHARKIDSLCCILKNRAKESLFFFLKKKMKKGAILQLEANKS